MSSNQRTAFSPLVLKTKLWLAAAALLFSSASALAMPKAAEHENAPVTSGIEVAKPKILSKPAKAQVIVKKKVEVKKTPHDAKTGKKAQSKK